MEDQLNSDIAYIQESVAELESFLLSEDVLRQLPGLTLAAGNILLAYHRISASNLENKVADAWTAIEGIRAHWKVAWTKKCHAEMRMRLRQWGDFILGLASDKHERSTAFRHQVRVRTVLQLLEDSVPSVSEAFMESVNRKDLLLKKYTVENDFLWEDEVKSGFPREKFWYLYRTMKYESEKS